jgi:Uma2 family endonuclease
VTEDDTPVDNIYAERQQRLLTSPLYSSWSGPGDNRTFLALANVGMFYNVHLPPLVPDCLLSLDVRVPADLHVKKNRSYFLWEFGKSPDVILEVVSNDEGGELGHKLIDYAQIGIPYYVVWDPFQFLKQRKLSVFALRIRAYELMDSVWLASIGLGLAIWHGTFEGAEDDWLRWCDRQGNVLLTGDERAGQAEQRTQKAEERAERLAAQLRKLGVEPTNGDEA